jgi:hypothetical protein
MADNWKISMNNSTSQKSAFTWKYNCISVPVYRGLGIQSVL